MQAANGALWLVSALVGVALAAAAAHLLRARFCPRRIKIGLVSPLPRNSTRTASGTELLSLAEPSTDGSLRNGSAHGDLNGGGYPSDDDNDASNGGRRRGSLTKRAKRYERMTPRRLAHRKGGKGAALAAADGDHSIIFAVTMAWSAALRDRGAGSNNDGTTDGDESSDVYGAQATTEMRTEAMIEAFTATLTIMETFGPLMGLAVKNDQANLDKVKTAWTALGAADPERCATVRGLLETEKGTGIHKPGGVLSDPSAAIALVWMRRSLEFQTAVLDALHTDRSSGLSKIGRDAYGAHLEQFHNFWLKNTFRAGLAAMPNRGEFLVKLAAELQENGIKEEELEAICYSEMAELVELQQKAIAALRKLFVELDLEDNRRA